MNQEWLIAVIPLAAGWIVSVERRLAKINTIDEKLDLLLDHIIPERKAEALLAVSRKADPKS